MASASTLNSVIEEGNDSVGKSLWKRARFVTTNAIAFSQSFKTLRDMVQEVYIEPEAITPVKPLGHGAFASVSLGTLDGRAVAVKYLKPSLLKSDSELKLFLQEAALLKKLRHSSIVNFVGLGIELSSPDEIAVEKQGPHVTTSMTGRALEALKKSLTMKNARSAIGAVSTAEQEAIQAATEANDPLTVPIKNVMLIQEYLTRGTLKTILLNQMERPLRRIYSRAEALDWLIQIAQGIKYLHGAKPKIIHRDLKLENIMMTLDAQDRVVAKIGDFGLHAVLKTPPHAYPIPNDTIVEGTIPITASAKTLKGRKRAQSSKASYMLSGKTGSLMYMAPEVLQCQPYNEKADVFAFALIIYELFSKCNVLCLVSSTGEPDEIEAYAKSVAAGKRPALPEEWPVEVTTLVRDCWAQSPIGRPNMTEITDRLKALRELDWILDERSVVTCCPFGSCFRPE